MTRPFLVTAAEPATVRGIVIVAHGGRETGVNQPSRFAPPLLRMIPFARDLDRHGNPHGLLVTQLRYRMTGYNDGSPVDDVRWAVKALSGYDVPIVLVGHSMGSRAALQAAGTPGVVGIVALAPWCPRSDPVDQLRDRAVMFAHGVDDKVTTPTLSYEYAMRTHAVTPLSCRFELSGSGHALLRRFRLWHSLTTSFVLGTLDMQPMPAQITAAMELPAEQACSMRL